MSQEVSKATMTRTRLKKNFFQNRMLSNKLDYNEQRNYCVKLLRKTKRDHYDNLKEKNVTDNKKFWKTVKTFPSYKTVKSYSIVVENDETLREEIIIA